MACGVMHIAVLVQEKKLGWTKLSVYASKLLSLRSAIDFIDDVSPLNVVRDRNQDETSSIWNMTRRVVQMIVGGILRVHFARY